MPTRYINPIHLQLLAMSRSGSATGQESNIPVWEELSGKVMCGIVVSATPVALHTESSEPEKR